MGQRALLTGSCRGRPHLVGVIYGKFCPSRMVISDVSPTLLGRFYLMSESPRVLSQASGPWQWA